METNHDELNRAVGRIEGKMDALIASVDAMGREVKDHASFIGNLKGKVAIISSGIAFTASMITLWVKKQFFND